MKMAEVANLDKINKCEIVFSMNQEELDAYRRKLATEYPDLRDSFAMAVAGDVLQTHGMDAVKVAQHAYQIADAMLIERAKR
jgi:hypothetical protein